MRKFYLENEKGERKGLNGELGIRLGNPAGLGVVFSRKSSEIGNGFLRVEEVKLKNEPVTCDLTFLPDAYARYRQLVNWIAGSRTLYLIYCPYGEQEFRALCALQYLTIFGVDSSSNIVMVSNINLRRWFLQLRELWFRSQPLVLAFL